MYIFLDLLADRKKGHLNHLSPIVSMETVAAAGATTDCGSLCDGSGDGDDSPMLLPAITKKPIVFNEEDELHALSSELDSRDDLDKIHEILTPIVTEAAIDTSIAPNAEEDMFYDKTISSPLVDETDTNGGSKTIIRLATNKYDPDTHNINTHNVKTMGNGNNGKEQHSRNINDSPPQNQRHNCVGKGGKIKQSISENGITQTLIERRSLLPLPGNANSVIESNNKHIGKPPQSNSSTAIINKNKFDMTKNANKSSNAISTDVSNDVLGR